MSPGLDGLFVLVFFLLRLLKCSIIKRNDLGS